MANTFYLPPSMKKQLEAIKERDKDSSIGAVARRLLRKQLDMEEKQK